MKLQDQNGTEHAFDCGLIRVSGMFDGLQVDAWVVPSDRVSHAVGGEMHEPMSQRVAFTDDNKAPLIVIAPSSFENSAGDLETVFTVQSGEGWNTATCPVDVDLSTDFICRLATTDLKVLGGDPESPFALIVDTPCPQVMPPVRVLQALPPTLVGGLNPFLSAIGAEPFAVMDSLVPLLNKLNEKGPGCVAMMSRAGAFFWDLDLVGREGLDAFDSQRIDEDVVVPLTAGLPKGENVQITTDLDSLLPRAREGSLDVAFLVNRPSDAQVAHCGEHHEYPANFLLLPNPFGLSA